jgi:hypothetical protein
LVAAVKGRGVYVWQTIPAPVLSITLSANSLYFSWTVPSMSFVLQQSANLIGANWTDIAATPLLDYTNLHYEAKRSGTHGHPVFSADVAVTSSVGIAPLFRTGHPLPGIWFARCSPCRVLAEKVDCHPELKNHFPNVAC